MNPEQIFQELKDLAEKLDVTVAEHSFRSSTIPVKSGYCLIKERMHCIIDKHMSLKKKSAVLAQTLAELPHENVFVVPAVRDFIKRHERKKPLPPGKGELNL